MQISWITGFFAVARRASSFHRWKQTKRRNKPSASRSQQMQTDRSFDVLLAVRHDVSYLKEISA